MHIAAEDGEEILTFLLTKEYQSLVVIFARIGERGDLRRIHRGSVTGTVVDSLCSGEGYSPGAEATRFTITSPVTLAGSATGGFMGGSGGMAGRDGFGGARPARP